MPFAMTMTDVDADTGRTLTDAEIVALTTRITAVVASDLRFACFGTAAFAVRLLRLDQKLADGIPMNLRRMANVLNTKPDLLREFCGHLAKPGDESGQRKLMRTI